MNRTMAFIWLLLPLMMNVQSVHALDSLDALLPTPHLLRTRSGDLDVDEPTQARIEQLYKAAEPAYHELKKELESRTQKLNEAIVSDVFDTEEIERRAKDVLESENKLKLYQVGVRVSLLSQVTAQQRQAVRNFASEKREENRWRGDAIANGELETFLPRPFWFRSRADELGVDAETKSRIERTYQTAEPEYHELKRKIKPLAEPFIEAVLSDRLDEEKIAECMAALLEAEAKLKLFQIRVRTSLLSLVSAQQRQLARSLAKEKPEANWRKVMAEKVERVRQLSEHLSDNQAVAEIEKRMTSIGKMIESGNVLEGARKIDQVLGELE